MSSCLPRFFSPSSSHHLQRAPPHMFLGTCEYDLGIESRTMSTRSSGGDDKVMMVNVDVVLVVELAVIVVVVVVYEQ